MKTFFWMTALILIVSSYTTNLFGQDIKLECDWKIIKIDAGKYKIQVNKFDSVEAGESCFRSWMNTGNGKPDGELLVYDEKGRKRRLAKYKSGIRVGAHYEWYDTGEVYDITNWETDLYFNSKTFYKSGKIKSTAVNGNRENAVYTSYYENGQIETLYDQLAGIDKTYYQSGQVKSLRSIKKRSYTEWYQNGKTKVTGTLDESGLGRVGKWKYYDEKGKLTRELFYDENNDGWYGDEKGYKTEKVF